MKLGSLRQCCCLRSPGSWEQGRQMEQRGVAESRTMLPISQALRTLALLPKLLNVTVDGCIDTKVNRVRLHMKTPSAV